MEKYSYKHIWLTFFIVWLLTAYLTAPRAEAQCVPAWPPRPELIGPADGGNDDGQWIRQSKQTRQPKQSNQTHETDEADESTDNRNSGAQSRASPTGGIVAV